MKQLSLALAITGAIFVLELAGGFFSNSLALLSDAGHMLTDTLALALALLAMYFSTRPATLKRTFGFLRLEILSALFNGSVLFLVALYIFYEAYLRLFHPAEIKSMVMLGIAAVGLLANIIGALILARGAKESLNIRGAFLHVISDAVSSVGVILGGLIIYFTGWKMIDPILGIMIAVLILRGAIGLLRESGEILLESTPRGVNLDEVVAEIKRVKGVKELHDVHLWAITSGVNAISAHILIEDDFAPQAADILAEVKARLEKKYRITHSTFQTECRSCPGGI